MKRSTKILLSLLALLIFSGCVLIASALVIWSYPRLVLNSRTLPWLISRAVGPESTFSSKQIDIEIQTPNFWRRNVRISAEEACLRNPETSSCFTGKIDWSLRLSFLHVVVIPNISIDSSDFSVDSKNSSSSEPNRQLSNNESELSDLPQRIERSLAVLESRRMNTIALRFDRVQLKANQRLSAFSFSFRTSLSEQTANFSFDMIGPSRISVNDCRLVWSGVISESTMQSRCSWTAAWPKNINSLKLFKKSNADFDSVLHLRLRNGQITEDSQLELIFNDLKKEAIEIRARMKPAKESESQSERGLLWELDLKGESFQKLKSILSRFNVEVPAPFHVLDGSYQLKWQGLIRRSMLESPSSDFFIHIHLASKEQKFDAEGKGRIEVSDIFKGPPIDIHLNLDLALKEIELKAPPLRLQSPPTLMPDGRFRPAKTQSDKTETLRLKFDVRLHTEKPLLIKTDLTRSPVPISFDLRFRTDAPITGNILVGRVALDFLRRDVELQRLSINFPESGRSRPIQGEIRVRYVGYTISILLDDDFSRPRIQLKSQPPLSEDDIHAVLLFGSPLASLDVEDVSSVASFKGAAVARAVTLVSLYFLVATPIQSISFNPQTMAFGAQVRLPRDIALRLGVEDEGAKYMGFRKRLSREVYLETELSYPQTDQNENRGAGLSTYLLWFKRH